MTDESDGLDLTRASIKLPKFEKWDSSKIYDYDNEILDYESLEDLNRTINQARIALFKTTDAIGKWEREEKEAKLEYERAYRRELLRSTAKTAEERRARAELMCEDLENAWLVKAQVREELVRLAYTLRQELQALQGLGHNLRQQIKI